VRVSITLWEGKPESDAAKYEELSPHIKLKRQTADWSKVVPDEHAEHVMFLTVQDHAYNSVEVLCTEAQMGALIELLNDQWRAIHGESGIAELGRKAQDAMSAFTAAIDRLALLDAVCADMPKPEDGVAVAETDDREFPF
jgi:hypothetical protein